MFLFSSHPQLSKISHDLTLDDVGSVLIEEKPGSNISADNLNIYLSYVKKDWPGSSDISMNKDDNLINLDGLRAKDIKIKSGTVVGGWEKYKWGYRANLINLSETRSIFLETDGSNNAFSLANLTHLETLVTDGCFTSLSLQDIPSLNSIVLLDPVYYCKGTSLPDLIIGRESKLSSLVLVPGLELSTDINIKGEVEQIESLIFCKEGYNGRNDRTAITTDLNYMMKQLPSLKTIAFYGSTTPSEKLTNSIIEAFRNNVKINIVAKDLLPGERCSSLKFQNHQGGWPLKL